MPKDIAPRPWLRWLTTFCLLVILLASLWLNLRGHDFPLGLHVDERTKVGDIMMSTPTFKHPLLILKSATTLAALTDASLPQEIVESGRITTAIFGALLCAFTFALARTFLSPILALLATALTAAAPGVVVHSHYLKEDIAMTCFMVASLLFGTLRMRQLLASLPTDASGGGSPRRFQGALILGLWGICLGLSLSTKYTALLLVFYFCLIPWFDRELPKRLYFRELMLVFVVSIVIFLLINHEMFSNFSSFTSGVEHEADHVISGHGDGIRLYPWLTFFTFHLNRSILPSFGILPTGLAVFGLILATFPRRGTDSRVPRWLAIFTILYYLVIEVAPLKPFPGYARYVVPLIPLLACLAAYALGAILVLVRSLALRNSVTLVVSVLLVAPLLLSSFTLTALFNGDSRLQLLPELIAQSKHPVAVERGYAGVEFLSDKQRESIQVIDSVGALKLDGEDRSACTVITSSFNYDRYLYAGGLAMQAQGVYALRDMYRTLFKYPHEDFPSGQEPFSFVNPTLRVTHLCGKSTP